MSNFAFTGLKRRWSGAKFGQTAALSNTTLEAAPGDKRRLVITDIIFTNTGTGVTTFKLQELQEDNSTRAQLISRVGLAAGISASHAFAQPVVLSENASLEVVCTVAGSGHMYDVYVQGYVERIGSGPVGATVPQSTG